MISDRESRPRTVPRGPRRFWRETRAAAAVEFAIVVPILVTIVFAVIDFGRALWTVNVGTAALREGARTAAAQVGGTSTCATAAATASGSTGRVNTYLTSVGFATATVYASCDASNLITVCFGTASACTNRYPFTAIAPLASKLVLTGGVKVSPAVFRWEKAS